MTERSRPVCSTITRDTGEFLAVLVRATRPHAGYSKIGTLERLTPLCGWRTRPSRPSAGAGDDPLRPRRVQGRVGDAETSRVSGLAAFHHARCTMDAGSGCLAVRRTAPFDLVVPRLRAFRSMWGWVAASAAACSDPGGSGLVVDNAHLACGGRDGSVLSPWSEGGHTSFTTSLVPVGNGEFSRSERRSGERGCPTWACSWRHTRQ